MISQLYSDSTEIKYPVEDTDTSGLPNDILCDLSLSVPDITKDVYLTNCVAGASYIFLSFETDSESVAFLSLENPKPFQVYPLSSDNTLSAGSVLLGPGALNPVCFRNKKIPLDRRCVVQSGGGCAFASLTVNGVSYSLPPVLRVKFEDGVAAVYDNGVVALARNDSFFTPDNLSAGLTDPPVSDITPITSVNGLSPDPSGNVIIAAAAADEDEYFRIKPIVTAESVYTGAVRSNLGFVLETGGNHAPLGALKVSVMSSALTSGGFFRSEILFESKAKALIPYAGWRLRRAGAEYIVAAAGDADPDSKKRIFKFRLSDEDIDLTANPNVFDARFFPDNSAKRGMAGCDNPYKELNIKIKDSVRGLGVSRTLPFDDVISEY